MEDNQQQDRDWLKDAKLGLNMDGIDLQVNPGQLTYALNAMIEGFDVNSSITYQNEPSNKLCVVFPEGYKVVGVKNVTSIDTVYYWLTNPTTGQSQVGFSTLNSCEYNVLLDDSISGSDLLLFNIAYPIHKIEVKTTNCATQLYWTDNFNPRRYVDLTNLPWKDTIVGGLITPAVGQIDANKLLVQPNFSVPKIAVNTVNIGGILTEGDYQFAVQYADVWSNGYTSFYSVTNEVRIFLDHKVSTSFNEQTNKSISITIDNLDTSGLYDYFNLAVIKTINAITSVELVGTFYIDNIVYQHTYTGEEQSSANIKLTIDDIFAKNDYYDRAGDLTQVDNILVWANLTKEDDFNYQSIWSQVNLQWETWQIPYNEQEGYYNGANCANYQGYMRDEVYPFEGCFILKNGSQTPRCHIPGRLATPYDVEIIANLDAQAATTEDGCMPSTIGQPRWKVYNTGSIIGTSTATLVDCKGPYQYGLMGYHESTELYPDNPAIWGALANTPIRHHRFPDSTITHIHDQNPLAVGTDAYNNYQHTIYPIGVKIDINQLRTLINSSTVLTQAQKDNIVGFKIMRGDRVADTSIIAKGLFYNCGEYTKDTSTYLYPNYPYNDTNPDPFISSVPVGNKSGANGETWLNDFQTSRFTFHSPDTHFYKPAGIQGSFAKMEVVTEGNCKAHFVPVKDNAGEKLRTVKDLEIALAGGVASIIGLQGTYEIGTSVGTQDDATTNFGIAPSFHAENFFPAFNNVLEITDKLIPYLNYGWQYNSVGYYGNFTPVADNGNKIRFIQYGGYLTSGMNSTFGDSIPINNSFRETSVYVSVSDSFPYVGDAIGSKDADNSRVTAGQMGLLGRSSIFYRNIASYYGSIKRYLPGQWGEIFSYQPIDTGVYYTFLDDNSNTVIDTPTIFGGDIFINRFALKRKHSFFTKNNVNKPDGTDIDYNQNADIDPVTGAIVYETNTGNVGYPIWYYSTSNDILSIDNTDINNALNNPTTGFIPTLNNWALEILTGGFALLVSAIILLVKLMGDGILTSLGIKVTNMDGYNGDFLYERGQAYQYAYGIPYFFCESEVNTDMRQATNALEGNFFPNVGSDIPDDWLQETNVPILYDNSYVYNKTYSKENKETFFQKLRPNWTPDDICYTNYGNRVIWSDKSSLEETKNNWLIYRPGNTKDLPKGYGPLQGIDSLKNNEILVRFYDKTQKYNAQTAIQVTQGPAAYIGNVDMFAQPPVDLIHSDTGRAGSQNAMLLKTDYGNIFVDAKRSSVFMLGQQQSYFDAGVQDLSARGMQKWFQQNLPFQILNYFPEINTDNAFNGIGICGAFDAYNDRFILTKKDYIPIQQGITYDGRNFYSGKTVIYLDNHEYFCNKSWTLSFSFKTHSWISFHSYIPDYYITYYSFFQSGSNALTSLFSHDYRIIDFSSFFGQDYPYILEYPFAYKQQDEILQNIKDFTTIRKYTEFQTWYSPNETLYFNKAIIYNEQQCSGVLNLVPRLFNNLSAYNSYPIYNPDSKSIQVTKSDNFFQFNQFWDVVIDHNQPIFVVGCDLNTTDKDLNQINMNYSNISRQKPQIRAKDARIRLINDTDPGIRLISKFFLAPSVPSYK